MTDRLDDKIRSLMAQVVEASPPAHEIEEIMELRLNTEPALPVTQLRPRVELRARRGWLIAVGAAVAVLVLIGATALLFQGTGTETPVATTPQIDSFSTLTWSRVPHDEAVFGGAGMESVTAGGPGLVAVGSGDDDVAAVWTSVDGKTWSRVAHDEAVFGGPSNLGMSSVSAGGPGLVAVGSADPHDGEHGVVWTSVGGITWSRVPDEEAVLGGEGEQSMGSVTAGGPGLVAVGWDLLGFQADAAVWTSVDGITWSRVPHDEAVFGGPSYRGMAAVTAGGPGLVAVGSADQIARNVASDGGQSAAVWTSVDGITWSRVPHDEAVFGGAAGMWMNSVTVGGPGLVAVGGDAIGAAVWTSVDGSSWSRVPHNEAIFGGAWMSSLTVTGAGLLAVGSDGEGAAVWTSPDGITWSRVPNDNAVFSGEGGMSSVTFAGPGLVVVGNAGEDAAVWVAVPEN